MIILAVIVGYVLGVAPFVVPKFYETMINRKEMAKESNITKQEEEILDEWLNGPRKSEEKGNNLANQQDIFNEYMTGIPTPKGD